MAATWKVTEPRAIRADDGPNFLDRENLMVLVGPGCFKCEREFSNRLARQPCRGSVTDEQPPVGRITGG